MNTNKNYYENQLALLSNGPYKIIIFDESGNKTKDLGLNPSSIEALLSWANAKDLINDRPADREEKTNDFITVFNKELESFSGLEESEKINKQILLIATAIGVISKKIEHSNDFEKIYVGSQTPIDQLRKTLSPFITLVELLNNGPFVISPFDVKEKNGRFKNEMFESLLETCSKHKEWINFYLADCEQFYNNKK